MGKSVPMFKIALPDNCTAEAKFYKVQSPYKEPRIVVHRVYYNGQFIDKWVASEYYTGRRVTVSYSTRAEALEAARTTIMLDDDMRYRIIKNVRKLPHINE